MSVPLARLLIACWASLCIVYMRWFKASRSEGNCGNEFRKEIDSRRMYMTKLVIRAEKATDDLLQFAANYPAHVQLIQGGRITGESAEFIAIVSLVGVSVKTLSDLVSSYLSRHKDIEISCKGVTVKGIEKDSAMEIIGKLVKDSNSGEEPS